MVEQGGGNSIIIGCGAFGKRAIEQVRAVFAAAPEAPTTLCVDANVATRNSGGEHFRAERVDLSPLRNALVSSPKPRLLCLVACAEEASSSSLLVATLAWLVEKYPCLWPVVWLRLPPPVGSEVSKRARGYATLRELLHLSPTMQPITAFCFEQRGADADAAFVGDALHCYACSLRPIAEPLGGIRGVGLAIASEEHAAPALVRRVTCRYVSALLSGAPTLVRNAISEPIETAQRELTAAFAAARQDAMRDKIGRTAWAQHLIDPHVARKKLYQTRERALDEIDQEYAKASRWSVNAKKEADKRGGHTIRTLQQALQQTNASMWGLELYRAVAQYLTELHGQVQTEAQRVMEMLGDNAARVENARRTFDERCVAHLQRRWWLRWFSPSEKERTELQTLLAEFEAASATAAVTAVWQATWAALQTEVEQQCKRVQQEIGLREGLEGRLKATPAQMRVAAAAQAPNSAEPAHKMRLCLTEQEHEEWAEQILQQAQLASEAHLHGAPDRAWESIERRCKEIVNDYLQRNPPWERLDYLTRMEEKAKPLLPDGMSGTAAIKPRYWVAGLEHRASDRLRKRPVADVIPLQDSAFRNEMRLYCETAALDHESLIRYAPYLDAYRSECKTPGMSEKLHVLPEPASGWLPKATAGVKAAKA